jgi:hypothetical protein
MHSLPFRLLVVGELDLQDPIGSGRPSWRAPGAVEESPCRPLWASKLYAFAVVCFTFRLLTARQCSNTAFPQELGLILLSAQPATIKSLRLSVEQARAPSQSR